MATRQKQLLLKIISQEKKLLEVEVSQVTIPSAEGEITILPSHIPLFAQVETGQLKYVGEGGVQSVVVSSGFVDVHADGTVTLLVDSAIRARDISVTKVQEAITAARETMKRTDSQRELLMAEASLKRAMWEMKVAQKVRRGGI